MTIMLATPHAGLVDPLWIDALLQLDKPHTAADGSPAWFRSSVLRMEIASARTILVNKFLQHEGATHILFWDDDVLPPRDGLLRLLAHDAPIVSGLYTTRALPVRPVAYTLDAQHAFQHVTTLHDGVQEVDGVGAGFLLIQREVFVTMEPPWFQFVRRGNEPGSLSEDLFFCEQAQQAGYSILLDAGVRCGHIGRYVYDIRDCVSDAVAPIEAVS